jgi:hypothetical protein
MNENSAIWPRLAATVQAVAVGCPSRRAAPNAASPLPPTITASVASTAHGRSTRTCGLKSMPTETKNSTAKASRSGNASSVARWLSGLSASTLPRVCCDAK